MDPAVPKQILADLDNLDLVLIKELIMSINDKQNLIEFYIKSKIFDDATKFSLIVSVINL